MAETKKQTVTKTLVVVMDVTPETAANMDKQFKEWQERSKDYYAWEELADAWQALAVEVRLK